MVGVSSGSISLYGVSFLVLESIKIVSMSTLMSSGSGGVFPPKQRLETISMKKFWQLFLIDIFLAESTLSLLSMLFNWVFIPSTVAFFRKSGGAFGSDNRCIHT